MTGPRTPLSVVGGTKHRRYTSRTKAAIVGRAEVIGTLPAAEEAGVPESTVRYWRESPRFAELREQKQAEVADDVWAAFQTGVRRIVELIPLTDDMSKVAVATGILYDKYALMSGQATDRSEHKELLTDFDDHEREAMSEWLREVARERLRADHTPA